jgi:pyruvate ferredoxin oxidoreductase alpha subunit
VATAVEQKSGIWAKELLLNGCQAVAQGVKLADVDVIAAYPIRPYTEVMDALSRIIADGELDSEYIVADSEHSQFEIVKHASSVGARAFAGSSGTGWMYGFEALVVTATDRLSPLFLVGNRALDDPGAFGVEHNDALAVRDMGWLLCWASTAQEALEHVLIGYRIAEDDRVRMPMALAMDGAFLTHSQHMVKLPTKEAVRQFLPPYELGNRRMHPDNPVSIAPQVNEDWVMELRRQNWEAARRAKKVVAEAYKEYNAIFGSRYTTPFFDEYMTEDADIVLLGLGAVCMPARTAVRRLRDKGKKVGYVNLRWFRPFPSEELRASLGRMKAVGVIDRDFAHGSPDSGGIVVHDVRSCLYPLKNRPAIANFIGGLGGRDISIDDCIRMFEITAEAPRRAPGDELVTWVGLRE